MRFQCAPDIRRPVQPTLAGTTTTGRHVCAKPAVACRWIECADFLAGSRCIRVSTWRDEIHENRTKLPHGQHCDRCVVVDHVGHSTDPPISASPSSRRTNNRRLSDLAALAIVASASETRPGSTQSRSAFQAWATAWHARSVRNGLALGAGGCCVAEYRLARRSASDNSEYSLSQLFAGFLNSLSSIHPL